MVLMKRKWGQQVQNRSLAYELDILPGKRQTPMSLETPIEIQEMHPSPAPKKPKDMFVTTSPAFSAARILEIELGQALPTLCAYDTNTGQKYQRALCLIRIHTHPLGTLELLLHNDKTLPLEYVQNIWEAFALPINDHLQQDGLPCVTTLGPEGLPGFALPLCSEEREQFLAQAPFVSVIICTRDRPELIPACVDSLLALRYPNYEILIVDNAPSTNATFECLQERYGTEPRIRYVREDQAGLSWARNRGIQDARGEILAFADDDVVVDCYWLIELVRGFSRAKNVACVTGLVLPMELETQAQFWFEEYGGFNKEYSRRIFDMMQHRPKEPLYPYAAGRFGTGASMAVSASFVREVGGFDLALASSKRKVGAEDIAFFFQVITYGYTLVYEPSSLLYHLHRRDYESLRNQVHRYGIGLTAYLTKSICDQPRLLLDLIIRIPFGFFFMINSRSPKNNKKSANYPRDLTMQELNGVLYGPYAYLWNRWETHYARKAFKKIFKTTRMNAFMTTKVR